METINHTVRIHAPAQKVWSMMLAPDTYRQWTAAAWPGSYYEGTWAKDARIRFICEDGSGTMAHIISFEPYTRIVAEHIALLLTGGVQDNASELAKDWIGTTEEYHFTELNGVTTLTTTLRTAPAFAPMFEKGFPIAMEALRSLCEAQLATAHA